MIREWEHGPIGGFAAEAARGDVTKPKSYRHLGFTRAVQNGVMQSSTSPLVLPRALSWKALLGWGIVAFDITVLAGWV